MGRTIEERGNLSLLHPQNNDVLAQSSRELTFALDLGVDIAKLLWKEADDRPVQREVKFELTETWEGPYPEKQNNY